MGRGLFRRTDRLRSSRDYRRVNRDGKRLSSRCFIVLLAVRSTSTGYGARLGITVSRRVGGAVARNRLKRRIREWFRRQRETLGADLDIVVIARPPAAALEYEAVVGELSSLLEGRACAPRGGLS